MSTSFSIVTRIVGVDRLTEVAKRAANSIKGLIKPIGDLNSQIRKADSSPLGRVGLAADGAGERVKSLLDRLGGFAPALAVLTGAGTLAGLFNMAKGWAEASVETASLAKQIGITTGQLGAFRFAAKSGRVETEIMDKSLAKLNKTLYDAATGTNADAAALFQRLGIKLRDAKGNIRNVADIMPQLAEAFRRNENPALRAAMATALFGEEGAKLIAILAGGRKALDDAAVDAKRFGTLTDAQAASAGRLDKAFINLDKATSSFSARISAAVAPRLTALIDRITEWTAANRELVGQAIERKLDGIERFVGKLSTAWKVAVAIPAVAWLMKTVEASDALDGALVVLGGTMAGPVLNILSVITASVWRMNAALWANPWVLAAAAAASAAYIIYDNWGNIGDFFEQKMGRVKAAFDQNQLSGINAWLREFNPVAIMADALNGLLKYLFKFDLYDAGAQLVRRLIQGIKDFLPSLDGILKPLERLMPTIRPVATPRYLGGGLDVATPAVAGVGGVGGAAASLADLQGRVQIDVNVRAPAGTSVDAAGNGLAAHPTTRVGMSMAN